MFKIQVAQIISSFHANRCGAGAALTHNIESDTLHDAGMGHIRSENTALVVTVRVKDAGDHQTACGIQLRYVSRLQLTDGLNGITGNTDIAVVTRCACTVYDIGVFNNKIHDPPPFQR